MSNRLAAPAAVLVFALAIPVHLHAGTPEAPTDQKTAGTGGIVVQGQADPKQRKVCHMETATGSVMPKRICRTAAEQELAQRQADRDMDRIRDRQLSGDQTTGLR
jgi:hypothetical protein